MLRVRTTLLVLNMSALTTDTITLLTLFLYLGIQTGESDAYF